MLGKWLSTIATLSILAAHPAMADDGADAALAVVRKFAAAPDRATYARFCASDMVYVDHVAPYTFTGPTACQDEWDAAERWAQDNKAKVTKWGEIKTPTFVDVSGDRVYAVFPAHAALIKDGRALVEDAYWTFVLQRSGSDWRIKAASFSTVRFAPAK